VYFRAQMCTLCLVVRRRRAYLRRNQPDRGSSRRRPFGSRRDTSARGTDTSLLTRGLVRFDWDVEDQRAVFAGMAAVLQAEGFVKKSFEAAIVAREAKYPTALPTVPEAIAIPHADAEHILTPFIAPLRLAHPVPWSEMG